MSSTDSTLERAYPQIALPERSMVTTLDPQNDQAADDKGQRHWHRMKQTRFDQAAESQSEHDCGRKCNRNVQRKPLRAAFAKIPATVVDNLARYSQITANIAPV